MRRIRIEQVVDLWVEFFKGLGSEAEQWMDNAEESLLDLGLPGWDITQEPREGEIRGDAARQVIAVRDEALRDHVIYISFQADGNNLVMSRGLAIEAGGFRMAAARAAEKEDPRGLGWELGYFETERLKARLKATDAVLNSIKQALAGREGEYGVF